MSGGGDGDNDDSRIPYHSVISFWMIARSSHVLGSVLICTKRNEWADNETMMNYININLNQIHYQHNCTHVCLCEWVFAWMKCVCLSLFSVLTCYAVCLLIAVDLLLFHFVIRKRNKTIMTATARFQLNRLNLFKSQKLYSMAETVAAEWRPVICLFLFSYQK